jgi:hypothetical protein
MRQLRIRHHPSVAEPLRQERLRRALAIIRDSQEDDQASCTRRQSLHPQSTPGRNDYPSDSIPSSLDSPTGMESVTDTGVSR